MSGSRLTAGGMVLCLWSVLIGACDTRRGGDQVRPPSAELVRQHRWAEWQSLEARARQVAVGKAVDPSAVQELQARLVRKARREFRERHRLSRRAFETLLVEGVAKDWIHSKYCRVDPSAVYQVCFHGLGPMSLAPIEGRYTPAACREQVEGVVILQLVVGPEGVRRTAVLRGLPAGLDEEAIRAAKSTTWLPPLVCGQPATVAYIVAVDFALPLECTG